MDMDLDAFAKTYVNKVIQSAKETLRREMEETQDCKTPTELPTKMSGHDENDTADEYERRMFFEKIRHEEYIKFLRATERESLQSGDNIRDSPIDTVEDVKEVTQNIELPTAQMPQEKLEIFNPNIAQDLSLEIHKTFSGTDVRGLSRIPTPQSNFHSLIPTADLICTETIVNEKMTKEEKMRLNKRQGRTSKDKLSLGRRILHAISKMFRCKSK